MERAQSQLDGAKDTSAEVFCICLDWKHPPGFSLAQALVKPLHSLFQQGPRAEEVSK